MALGQLACHIPMFDVCKAYFPSVQTMNLVVAEVVGLSADFVGDDERGRLQTSLPFISFDETPCQAVKDNCRHSERQAVCFQPVGVSPQACWGKQTL